MKKHFWSPAYVLAIALSTASAGAADLIGLTPLGAEKIGNQEGTIPAWTGGLPTDAASINDRGFQANPFTGEKPLFVITAESAEKYRKNLSEGQLAMLRRYPQTYRLPVYPSHRTLALPQRMYDAAETNAKVVRLGADGLSIENFTTGHYPFPQPRTGTEVIWNHQTRYLGGNFRRWITQATPQVNGQYTMVHLEEEVVEPALAEGIDPQRARNLLQLFKQTVTSPARMAGNVLLVHETLDQVKEPRLAWVYNAGQRRVRRAPQVAYDGPGTASDGLRTTDNHDMFNGAMDRYDWRLLGKREMYIPYNSYELDSPALRYDEVIKPGHINQDLTRYELHRVWVVEATLREGQRNIYAKRVFYVDEDSWQIALSEHYDGRGQLWRVGEGHAKHYFNQQHMGYTLEVLYDLLAGRYVALGMKNEEDRSMEYGFTARMSDFTPSALRKSGVR
ncbi:DUF1329 domain-containing protein [Pseudomonas sp. BN414]|uniref:DUF1329 domain-containing protein n=1 Tax=unclassified Pseudomonas TaxID=196821 RepID=UPI0024576123|nr:MULTISPECIES: DUF1329 domain-containing protein [unclassified Pseudomonas]MDH4568984.1 DUF1329 domain-containing protein [Pseudomonas sp. BN414]MDH4656793.1 DUF1329 domain-containing protein [Pseudomonas sp. BN606]WVK91005.1 DUF1329 domain-containing protein [Pseudomonas sp. JS3066]